MILIIIYIIYEYVYFMILCAMWNKLIRPEHTELPFVRQKYLIIAFLQQTCPLLNIMCYPYLGHAIASAQLIKVYVVTAGKIKVTSDRQVTGSRGCIARSLLAEALKKIQIRSDVS